MSYLYPLLLFVGFPVILILFTPLVILSFMGFARASGMPAEAVSAAVAHLMERLGPRGMAIILFLSGAVPAVASIIWGAP